MAIHIGLFRFNLTEHNILFWEENNKCCLYSKVMGETWEGGGCWTHFKRAQTWDKEPEKASLEEGAGECSHLITLTSWKRSGGCPHTPSPTTLAACNGIVRAWLMCPGLCVCTTMSVEREETDKWHRPQNLRSWSSNSWPEAAGAEEPTAHQEGWARLPTAAGARMPGQIHAGSFWARYEWLERSRL